MKVLMVLVLVAVLGALASAGFFMLRRDPDAGSSGPAARDRRMARALALRVALCVALFIVILAAWAMGWLRPGGIPVPV